MTDKPKWTPGPWAATSEDNGEWDIYSESWDIATVAARAGMEDPNGRSDANAHLIAAAPDLAEALDCLAKWFEGSGESIKRQWDRVPPEARVEVRRLMLAALAKARGETK